VEDAGSVARRLGIPYYVFNFSRDFKAQVIERFAAAYESGATPNPCIDCNRYLKFERLFQRARELGCEAIVTGHYARIEKQNGRYILKKALDKSKDQSYVLYMLTQEQLAHIRFPLGELGKLEVRSIAEAQGFCNSEKPDSQDICFIPDGDYAAFLEQYTGKPYPTGDVLDLSGHVIGQHRGAVRYTTGQRKGLGLALNEPVYVCRKDMTANTVTVGPEQSLYSQELWADDVNWIATDHLSAPMRVYAKIRYRQTEQPATVCPDESGKIRLLFDKPQRAITAGQAAVLYNSDIVVGGGTILKTVQF
jgi:tRNA-specific 2-thiouridylase